jgi:hypothetical protein
MSKNRIALSAAALVALALASPGTAAAADLTLNLYEHGKGQQTIGSPVGKADWTAEDDLVMPVDLKADGWSVVAEVKGWTKDHVITRRCWADRGAKHPRKMPCDFQFPEGEYVTKLRVCRADHSDQQPPPVTASAHASTAAW